MPRQRSYDGAARFATMMAMKVIRKVLFALVSMLDFLAGRAYAMPEADFWQWFQRNETMLFEFERDREKTFDLLATELRKVKTPSGKLCAPVVKLISL